MREVIKVALHMRRHVIGPRGRTVQRLRQEYPTVRVTVPSLDDLLSQAVVLQGFKSQVAAAARDITLLLQDIESKLREAVERRQAQKQQMREVQMEVAPGMRRRVAGAGGEALIRLEQEHPSVRVIVPPRNDTTTGTITLRGPLAQATAVRDTIARPPQTAAAASPPLQDQEVSILQDLKNSCTLITNYPAWSYGTMLTYIINKVNQSSCAYIQKRAVGPLVKHAQQRIKDTGCVRYDNNGEYHQGSEENNVG